MNVLGRLMDDDGGDGGRAVEGVGGRERGREGVGGKDIGG